MGKDVMNDVGDVFKDIAERLNNLENLCIKQQEHIDLLIRLVSKHERVNSGPRSKDAIVLHSLSNKSRNKVLAAGPNTIYGVE